jgi:putative transposon-encoded protein
VDVIINPIISPVREARDVESCKDWCVLALENSYALYQACLRGCKGRSLKQPLEIAPVPAIAVTEVGDFFKVCYEKCVAAYGSSGIDYVTCLLQCSIGGEQKLDKVDIAIKPIAPVREARDVKNCEKQCVNALYVSYPVYQICVTKCQPSRSLKKPLEISPVPAIAVTEVGDFFKVCYEKCVAAYGTSGTDFASCIFRCNIGGQKLDKVGIAINPVAPVREARGSLADCKDKSLFALVQSDISYAFCVRDCNEAKSLKEPLEIVQDPVVADSEFKTCYEKCVAAYGFSGTDYATSLLRCTVAG